MLGILTLATAGGLLREAKLVLFIKMLFSLKGIKCWKAIKTTWNFSLKTLQENSLSLKLRYYFDYQYLKRK